MGAFAIAIAVLLSGSSAFAAQNVGNTSQKGSLLIFPNIDIDSGDTIVRISNDANTGVDVTCYYINERKGRRDFHFKMTRKQPVWFSVYYHSGTFPVAQFPDNAASTSFVGNVNKGALLCWATNNSLSAQISHNHLSGTATVTSWDGDQTSYTYPSWNFTARNVLAGSTVGTPGRLDLTGVDGAYDACPSYLIGHFTPAGGYSASGYVQDNVLSVASCNQDLRQDFTPHFTKLQMQVWNEQEVKFTGAYECSDGSKSFLLYDETDVGYENFNYDTLQSVAAQVKVKGVASTQCVFGAFKSEASGLVGVLAAFGYDFDEDDYAEGTTMNGAGAQTGFILWDAQDAVVPELR
jgi:hypothetical protein